MTTRPPPLLRKLVAFTFGLGLAMATSEPLRAATSAQAYVTADLTAGTVLAAHNPDRRLRPASLAKVMTLHLLFDALDSGRIKAGDRVKISPHAAAQPPVRLGLKAGASVALTELIQASAIYSANDAAVALAEYLYGSEPDFVRAMNARARKLGLANTRFANASGLPAEQAYTSARDMVLLSRVLFSTQAEHAKVFSQHSFKHAGRIWRGHNAWLNAVPGADGLKTGFTCRAGYHLAASRRTPERHLMTVVLGAVTRQDRLSTAVKLMRALPKSGDMVPLSAARAVNVAPPGAVRAQACKGSGLRAVAAGKGPSGWSISLALYPDRNAATAGSKRFISRYGTSGRPYLTPRTTSRIAYQGGVTDLNQKSAQTMCLKARSRGEHCIVQPPVAARLNWMRAVKSVRN